MITKWQIPLLAWDGEPCFVVGGGPSLRHVDMSRIRGRGRVIAVNNAGLDLAPWADILFWADKRWFEWNRHRIRDHTGQWKVARTMPYADEPGIEIKVIEKFRRNQISYWADSIGGRCGGSSAINLAWLLGCNPIILLGFDMRDVPMDRWQEGNYHRDHQAPPLEGQRRNRFVPVLEQMAPVLERSGVLVLNTNPRSGLRCFPFADLEELLQMDDIAKAEREKYLAVWEREEYRRVSPGMLECEKAFRIMGMQAGESVTDFGSGPMRATNWFHERGLDVLGVDFAANASEFPQLPFVEACLWDMPDSVRLADYGFCCDVMEHIPGEKLFDTLAGIRSKTRKAVYFRIATRPDKMGPRLLGKPLHMTVRDGDFWRRELECHWDLVDAVRRDDRDIVLLARP